MSYQQPYPNYGPPQGGAGYPGQSGPGYGQSGPGYSQPGPGYGQPGSGYGQPGPGSGQQPPSIGFDSFSMNSSQSQNLYGPPSHQSPYPSLGGGSYNQQPAAHFPGNNAYPSAPSASSAPYGGGLSSGYGPSSMPGASAPNYPNYPAPAAQPYQPSPGPPGYPSHGAPGGANAPFYNQPAGGYGQSAAYGQPAGYNSSGPPGPAATYPYAGAAGHNQPSSYGGGGVNLPGGYGHPSSAQSSVHGGHGGAGEMGAPYGGGYGQTSSSHPSNNYSPASNNYNSPSSHPSNNRNMSDSQGYFNPYGHQGTVRPLSNFNANDDAEALHKAMKGIGCNDKAVMSILCFRSNAQRQQIKQAFKTMYGKDLVKNLVDELKGHFEDVVVALMDLPADYDAKELRGAMKGLGTTESTLIEILATRTNQEIIDIKHAYRFHFARDLEKDLLSETSGDFCRMLVSMCAGGRDESTNVDPGRAKTDAERLYKAGEKRLGTDEAMFNAILASQNFAQLQRVFQEYQRITTRDIEKALANEFSGDILDGWLTVVKCVKNRPQYFAENLYRSMKGMGTNDHLLIRTVVTRCEKDMVQIKQEFLRMYKKSLDSFISGDTSGAYKNALIALVTGRV